MAGRRIRISCFVCNEQFNAQQLRRINGEENVQKRQIAITRRDERDFPPAQLNDESRLCANCYNSILNEIAAMNADPNCLRLNILTQTASQTCIICNAHNNLQRLSVACRVNVFIETNIFIPSNVRSCEHHLNDDGLFLNILLPGLRFINRPYVIKGTEMLAFLNQLRKVSRKSRCLDENDLNDDEWRCIAPISKEQFNDMYTFCDSVEQNGKRRYVQKKDLLTFLCKLRQGLSDDFLKVIFNYKSRQTVSSVIDYVRLSLLQRFVPQNIGPASITRREYIDAHVTDFSNILYNPRPDEPKAIAVIDATYTYIHKSSNFRTLRQSYSMHKNRHLLKPTLVVAPDGYILEIFGPYFSDARNNDAQILTHEFENDGDLLREWFENGDIVLVDRGYRDALPFLHDLGIETKMPSLLPPGQRQLSTEDANASRLVTKSRWIVEGRNGHLRSIFHFFEKTVNLCLAKNLNAFYRIAGAILNKYYPPIHMQNATPEMAREMLARSQNANVVQLRVEVDNLRLRNGQWRRLNHHDVPHFPVLDLVYLKDLTVGVYQVNLARSYIEDKLIRDNDEEFQLDENINDPGFIRIRVYSRFRNATKHQVFIAYRDVENDDDEENGNEPIQGYYCTCQSGARTLGSCAHVASVLWFLGYARHQENIRYPDTSLLDLTLDAANRQHNDV